MVYKFWTSIGAKVKPMLALGQLLAWETVMKNICRLLSVVVLAASITACVNDMSKPESQNDYATDCDLANKVQRNIASDPTVKHDAIVVKCYEGVVCLTGKVASKAEEDRILQLVRQVPGVLWVKDNLIIFPI